MKECRGRGKRQRMKVRVKVRGGTKGTRARAEIPIATTCVRNYTEHLSYMYVYIVLHSITYNGICIIVSHKSFKTITIFYKKLFLELTLCNYIKTKL